MAEYVLDTVSQFETAISRTKWRSQYVETFQDPVRQNFCTVIQLAGDLRPTFIVDSSVATANAALIESKDVYSLWENSAKYVSYARDLLRDTLRSMEVIEAEGDSS
jgi:uncharacterized protein YnzC (UPF0291/DUF896 family)